MEIKKSIQSTTAPLEELIKKGASVDFRLDQAAWKDLAVGDLIEYWEDFTGWQTEPTDASRRVIARIEHIYKAPTFPELFAVLEADGRLREEKDELLASLRRWWSEETETAEGTLAFYVRVVKG